MSTGGGKVDPVVSTDHSLVVYMRQGSESAAEELFRRYAARLRSLVADRCDAFRARFDTDDVIQSVFRTLYDGIRKRQYEVPKGGDLWGLLSVLAVNKAKDWVTHHRAAKRNVFRTVVGDDEMASLFSQEKETTALLKMVVDEYLAGLSEADREVVGLRMTGHTVNEIAEQTGRAIRTVERTLHKARDQLADVLQT